MSLDGDANRKKNTENNMIGWNTTASRARPPGPSEPPRAVTHAPSHLTRSKLCRYRPIIWTRSAEKKPALSTLWRNSIAAVVGPAVRLLHRGHCPLNPSMRSVSAQFCAQTKRRRGPCQLKTSRDRRPLSTAARSSRRQSGVAVCATGALTARRGAKTKIWTTLNNVSALP